jgi:Putative Flp pilus-assembly TadE/G-like
MVQSPKSKVQSRTIRTGGASTLDLGHWTLDLHADERGSISFATVFALLLLTMLLGMVINTGRQIDSKIKLQDAADASTYSGGIVIARGMNSLAYSNHLLCEVMAMTAFLREGRDRHAEPLVPEILAAWDRIGPVLEQSGFEKFETLGRTIPQKTPLEQNMVTAYSDWMAAASEIILPVVEEILITEAIPDFQRQVVQATPTIAQTAAYEIGNRHTGNPSQRDRPRGPITGVLWRMMVDPVGGGGEQMRGTLPAIDPASDTDPQAVQARSQAISQRDGLARHYLRLWNNVMMQPFDQHAKMSQFGRLWRGFTCAQLERVIQENSVRNYPHVIRDSSAAASAGSPYLDDYQFVGVAYRRKVIPASPRFFTDSLGSDNQAFAQGMLFIPHRRIVWYTIDPMGIRHSIRQGVPTHWDLWNQNWSFQLSPATSPTVAEILAAQPYTAGTNFSLPNLSSSDAADLRRLTTH